MLVALLAASPVGELLIAIPTGFAQGLPLLQVAILSVVFNFLPIPFVLILTEVGGNHPRIEKLLAFFRREKVLNIAQRYGFWGVAFLAPLTGVYAMAVAAWVLGIKKTNIMFYIFIGLIAYSIGTCLILLGGLSLFRHWVH
jgi:uncharacterized membrane protein